jgi:hypothetical protein
VLRVPANYASAAGGKDTSMRDRRLKPTSFTTLSGKSVVIKENHVYSNKGNSIGISEKRPLILDRIQISHSGANPIGYNMVSRFPGAASMAGILHIKATSWYLRGHKDTTSDLVEKYFKWQTTPTPANNLAGRFWPQQPLTPKEGYQDIP